MEPFTLFILYVLARGVAQLLKDKDCAQYVDQVVCVVELAWLTVVNWFEGNRVSAEDSCR